MELYRKASGKLVFLSKPVKNVIKEDKNDISLFVEWCQQNSKNPKLLEHLYEFTRLGKEV